MSHGQRSKSSTLLRLRGEVVWVMPFCGTFSFVSVRSILCGCSAPTDYPAGPEVYRHWQTIRSIFLCKIGIDRRCKLKYTYRAVVKGELDEDGLKNVQRGSPLRNHKLAARRVFVEKGFYRTTTRELAEAAGVSEVPFKHFPE